MKNKIKNRTAEELEKKIREEILKESMEVHNINTSLHFTKDAILKALKTYGDVRFEEGKNIQSIKNRDGTETPIIIFTRGTVLPDDWRTWKFEE